jgi:hypothetical protein
MLVYLVLYYKILPNKIKKLNYVSLFGFEYVLWIYLIGIVYKNNNDCTEYIEKMIA